jgi:hypothetical protein
MAGDTDDLLDLVNAGAFEQAGAEARRHERLAELAAVLPSAVARTGYLEVDLALVRLLEDVLEVTDDPRALASLQLKLAFELRCDPTAADRCRDLLDRAEAACDDDLIADVVLARLQIAELAPADERLAVADRGIALARRAGRTEIELVGRLARFHALLDLRRVVDAAAELGRYERLGGPAPDVRTFVESRRAMLATTRGAYDLALAHADKAHAAAVEAGMPDADRLLTVLRSTVAVDRRDGTVLAAGVALLNEMLQLAPGQAFEATLARVERARGNETAARTALARARPALRDGRGVRWRTAACDAAHAAAGIGPLDHVAELHAALLGHVDAETFLGPTYSGSVVHAVADLEVRLGRAEDAIDHARTAVARYDALAAVGWAAAARYTLADALDLTGSPGDAKEAARLRDNARDIARDIGMRWPVHRGTEHGTGDNETSVWRLIRNAEGWTLQAGGEVARLPRSRGLEALATLVSHPHQEIDAVVLDGGDPALADAPLPSIDDEARRAYRARLDHLDALLDRADAAGDAAAADRLTAERDALLDELRRATGLAGRDRKRSGDRERARVNVTRNLKRAVDRIGQTAPTAAEHLAASLRTGLVCRYEPDPTGPQRWETGSDLPGGAADGAAVLEAFSTGPPIL